MFDTSRRAKGADHLILRGVGRFKDRKKKLCSAQMKKKIPGKNVLKKTPILKKCLAPLTGNSILLIRSRVK